MKGNFQGLLLVGVLAMIIVVIMWNNQNSQRSAYSLPGGDYAWKAGLHPEKCRARREACLRQASSIGAPGECQQEYEYCMEYAS